MQDWSSEIKKHIDGKLFIKETEQLFKTAKENNFNSKSKYIFNDLDNSCYIKGDALVVTSQNSGFYIVKNDNDYTY